MLEAVIFSENNSNGEWEDSLEDIFQIMAPVTVSECYTAMGENSRPSNSGPVDGYSLIIPELSVFSDGYCLNFREFFRE